MTKLSETPASGEKSGGKGLFSRFFSYPAIELPDGRKVPGQESVQRKSHGFLSAAERQGAFMRMHFPEREKGSGFPEPLSAHCPHGVFTELLGDAHCRCLKRVIDGLPAVSRVLER